MSCLATNRSLMPTGDVGWLSANRIFNLLIIRANALLLLAEAKLRALEAQEIYKWIWRTAKIKWKWKEITQFMFKSGRMGFEDPWLSYYIKYSGSYEPNLHRASSSIDLLWIIDFVVFLWAWVWLLLWGYTYSSICTKNKNILIR